MKAEERAKEITGPVILAALERAGLKIVWKAEYDLLQFAARTNPDEIQLAIDKLEQQAKAGKGKEIND